MTPSRPSSTSGWKRSAGETHDAALASELGGGALGSGRLPGLPQLRERDLQLAGRAGERRRTATDAVGSYSAPCVGGCAALTDDPGR